MEQIDAAVIGGGVVGLAAARGVAGRGHGVCVLEKEPGPGRATSTHNSQVIHAGLYYRAGSLKAKHCVNGARMMYEFCAAHGVPHRRCGKLVVAHDETEVHGLDELRAKGTANGVEGPEIVDAPFGRKREPHPDPVAALLSPDSGILEAEVLVRTLARLISEEGGYVLPGTAFTAGEPNRDAIELVTPSERIHARAVVNAARTYAEQVSAAPGGPAVRILACSAG